MQKNKIIIHFIVFTIAFFIAVQVHPDKHIFPNVSNVLPAVALKEKNLREEIEEKKESYEEQPQDAYIDEVWKKTPGRNGRKVDVEKSLEKMKKENRFDESLLVYKNIKPKVSIEDLPPAPIYRGHPEKQMVSLLINVAWGTEHIPTILEILEDQKVRANFFLDGKWAKENMKMVKKIAEAGHVIGSHAYNHPDMAMLTEDQMKENIEQTNNIIQSIIGHPPEWFAPPSGSFNDKVVEIAHQFDMETILWTVDTIDWKKPSVSVMINRVISNIHPGAMILMHPTPSVANGLAELIDELKQKDYQIDAIDKLLDESR